MSDVYADRSELGLGVEASYSSPRTEAHASPEVLGMYAPNVELNLLTQLGLSQRWSLGVGVGWRHTTLERELSPTVEGSMCPEELTCRQSSFVATAHSAALNLRLTYTPLDWLSPTLWGDVGGWRRWRTEGYEQLKEGSSALLAHELERAAWWGSSLTLGGGLYWRFLSRWSTVIGVQLRRDQIFDHPSTPPHHLSVGLSAWLSYHHYVRLF